MRTQFHCLTTWFRLERKGVGRWRRLENIQGTRDFNKGKMSLDCDPRSECSQGSRAVSNLHQVSAQAEGRSVGENKVRQWFSNFRGNRVNLRFFKNLLCWASQSDFLIPRVWDESSEFAFRTSSHSMLMLLAWGTHFEKHWGRTQSKIYGWGWVDL